MNKSWYIAVVNRNTEKACREKLQKLGYESYVASRTELHDWKCGKSKDVETVVIPAVLFIHATEEERRFIVNFPFIHRFLTNKSQSRSRVGTSNHPFATLSDIEMANLQRSLATTDLSYMQELPPTMLPLHLSQMTRIGA
ncbi:MAG: UpxY family transcription antiterminator [Bacteroidaceae bacterium]|nr:UpxY family transcription antiterminator [Bacteroidaceae bacterium]MBR1519632.1 UpxY family transcription antiterminator [Bacteroidaceae bacterium]